MSKSTATLTQASYNVIETALQCQMNIVSEQLKTLEQSKDPLAGIMPKIREHVRAQIQIKNALEEIKELKP